MSEEQLPEGLVNEVEEREDGAVMLTVPLGDGDDLKDFSAERALVEANGGEIPEQPEPIGVEPSGAITGDPYFDLRRKIEEKFTKAYNEDTLVVDELERRRFLRSALHGEPMWFDVYIEGVDATIRVTPAPASWSDTITHAINQLQQEGDVGSSTTSWVEAFQAMHIWAQIDRVDGVPKPWYHALLEERRSKGEPLPGFREMLGVFKSGRPIEEVYHIGAAQRYILMAAIRIAEIKMCMCTNAISDRSFFSPAGTN